MRDPLSEVIALLRPRTVFTKGISGAGRWGVRYSEFGEPSFCAVLEGSCRLVVDGRPEIVPDAGDFVLLPATPGFTLSGLDPVAPKRIDPKLRDGLLDAATKAAADTRTHGLAVEKEALQVLADKGVQVIHCDKEPFRKRVLPQADSFVKVHPEAKPVVDAIRATQA